MVVGHGDRQLDVAGWYSPRVGQMGAGDGEGVNGAEPRDGGLQGSGQRNAKERSW